MGQRATPWELWALALLGLWLQFFRGRPAAAPVRAGSPPAVGGLSDLGRAVGGGALAALHLLGMLLIAGAAAGFAVLGVRLWMRRRRLQAMMAEEIVLGPDDVAEPDEMVAALDAIHGQLLTRYGGTAVGQVSWAFEMVRDRDGQIHFILAAPHGWLKAIEDVWRSVYTNLRFRPWSDVARPWPVAQQIVLARHWRHPTRIDADYTSSVVEMIVQALDRADGEARLQWLLTPLPVGPLTAALRGSLKDLEYAAQAAKTADPAHPGLGVVDRQDVSQATALLGRSAYRAEVRLAADRWDTMQRVYGALQGANAANQWQARTVWLFRGLWTRWLERRVPSLAVFGRVTLFSKPLATVIHVPSARLRVQSLSRMLVRRGPAPPAIPRDPALAILKDEIGPVGIPEGDRKFNTLFIGSQGGGKSTGMLRQIWVDAAWRDRQGRPKALAIIDIGKDTAKRALGIIPRDREVVWFDPTDPACPWTVNPLAAGVHESALANDVLEGLTQVFGDDAIRARSREFLGNAILAVKEVHGDRADFAMVYKMLTDDSFRQNVVDNVRDPHQRDYWQGTFTQTVMNNPRFVEEGLAAPRNKLDEVLRSPAIRDVLTAGGGRRQLNLRDIVTGRKVLVANLDKARLGKSGARLLGVFLITMLWHALESQTDIPEDDRVPTALVIDEAQNFISEGFLDILAEGRAYGAQTTLAVRFLGEILSDRAILGVRTLVKNLIIYQFELREEAEDFMKRFMRTYSNMVSPSDEAQDNINFGADDFMRLPKHHVVCRWMVDGSPQQAFLAETIPWEPLYDDAVKQEHLARQPRRDETTNGFDEGGWRQDETATALEGGSGEPWNDDPWTAVDAGSGFATPVSEGEDLVEDDRPGDPPRWLHWLMGPVPVDQWWDAETGAGLAPVWDRVRRETGRPWVWALEGISAINPAWVPAVRRRAVSVARQLAGPDAVIAWLDAETLGVWAAPDADLREEAWREAGKARNLAWRRRAGGDPENPDDAGSHAGQPGEEPPIKTPSAPPPPREKAAKRSKDEEAVLTPAVWARFTAMTNLSEATVREWQRAAKATDAEIAGTVRWMLKNHIGEEQAAKAFHKVLRQKLDDRWLDPLCDQLHATQKAVRDVFIGRDDVAFWVRWAREHPEVTSVKQLAEAVNRHRPIPSSRR